MRLYHRPVLTFAALSACLAGTATHAQEGEDSPSRSRGTLEEIIVTAEKRAESIQSMPIAISAYDGELLAERGIEGMDSLQQIAPSLQMGNRIGSLAKVSIRGISTEVGDIFGEPAMTISQDGVAYANQFMLGADFFDVERVEVLRGPQGTISGRNATAGAINVHSKRPTEDFEGAIKATVGNYSRLATEGYLSGPLSGDRLLGRFAVRSDRSDGWVDVVNLGEELGVRDRLQARASLLAKFTDSFEADLIVESTRDRSNTVAVDAGRARPDMPDLTEVYDVPRFDRSARTVYHDQGADLKYEKSQATLKLNWELGESVNLSATSGYVDLYWRAMQDHNDATAVPTVKWDPRAPLEVDSWQASQEVTLTADLTDRLDVIVGALYLRSDSDESATIGLPLSNLPLGFLTTIAEGSLKSLAGYTQWRFRVTDALRLTAGARYTQDDKTYGLVNVSFGVPSFSQTDATWSAWTPRFAIDFAPTDHLTMYASVARGFKSGGWSPFSVPTVAASKFEPEYVWNYETGVKAGLLDGRATTALTLFYMDYTDLQQSIAGLDQSRPGQSFLVVNAESATIKGVELEFDARLTDAFRLTLGATYLDATYDRLFTFDVLFPELGTPGPAGVNVRDLSGNRLVRAPELQANVTGEYRAPLAMFGDRDLEGVLRLSYAWQDDIYFNIYNHEAASQGSYGVVNLSAGVESGDGNWRVTAFAQNLTDEFYFTGLRTAVFNAPGYQTAGYASGTPGLPRMYGISIERRF